MTRSLLEGLPEPYSTGLTAEVMPACTACSWVYQGDGRWHLKLAAAGCTHGTASA